MNLKTFKQTAPMEHIQKLAEQKTEVCRKLSEEDRKVFMEVYKQSRKKKQILTIKDYFNVKGKIRHARFRNLQNGNN